MTTLKLKCLLTVQSNFPSGVRKIFLFLLYPILCKNTLLVKNVHVGLRCKIGVLAIKTQV